MPDEAASAARPNLVGRHRFGCGVFFAGLIGGGLLVAACGGPVYLSATAAAEDIVRDLDGNAVVTRNIGPIRDAHVDLADSFSAAQDGRATAGQDEYVLDVVGAKGPGRLRVNTTGTGGRLRVASGYLELPSDDRHELFP